MNDGPEVPYIAVLVFRTEVGGGYAPARFSEDIVLIRARSPERARAVAETRGREEETSYANEYGETVTWAFVGVADVREALYDSLDENVTLYSRSFDDLARYRQVFSSDLAPHDSEP
ncbi:hypothetical protein GCM10010140_42200 [Streptosporangium pseudovulgare]|uniref:DUF4288 domain-containing protein n=1 Tax=Streptosporangium pseudovulgare TaxID=35765 RepID=A0ABQ2R0M6_9ACTN|nr:hypothetical protein GCM10010140_42200 [Streptosporangium pseudovulgare]